MRAVFADVILVLHFGIAAWIVLGLAALWIGGWCGWQWTRRPLMRTLHAFAILVVAVQSVVGVRCPLTVWEDALRGIRSDSSFVQRWIGRLLYYDLPDHVFTLTYLAAVAATALAWWVYPSRALR
jgi:hypothetical protein